MMKGGTGGLACSDGLDTAIGTTEVVEHLVSEDNSPLEDKNPWSTGSLAILTLQQILMLDLFLLKLLEM